PWCWSLQTNESMYLRSKLYLQVETLPLVDAAMDSQLAKLEPIVDADGCRLFRTIQTTAMPPITTAPARATHSTVTKPSSAFAKRRKTPTTPRCFVLMPFNIFFPFTRLRAHALAKRMHDPCRQSFPGISRWLLFPPPLQVGAYSARPA